MTAPDGPPWGGYALAAGAVALATGLCFALHPFLDLTNLVMVYLLATLVVAARGWRGPAVLSATLGVLCFDFFFVPPRFSFAVSDTQYILTFLVMFATALVISHLTTRIRAQAEEARLGEARASALYSLSSLLAASPGLDAALGGAARHLAEVFECDVTLLLPSPSGRLAARAASSDALPVDEKGLSVAQWVFESGDPAGLGTDRLTVADALYVPLVGAGGAVGVLSARPRRPGGLDAPGRAMTLETYARQVGLALEVDRLQEEAQRARLEAEKERLRSSLLSSVSHDLRTPLAGIIGSASGLLKAGAALAPSQRELVENIQGEGLRLSRLVDNLIETTRLESGDVRLKKEPTPLEEPLGAALERSERTLAGRQVATDLPEDLPLVPIDTVLLEQVFINLLENAARHTPAGTPVSVSARPEGGAVVVEVRDHGPGLSADELERVFEKFYHAKSPGAGAGLGLAICRAVVNAHGGRIWAENVPGGGAAFRFTLPLKGAA